MPTPSQLFIAIKNLLLTIFAFDFKTSGLFDCKKVYKNYYIPNNENQIYIFYFTKHLDMCGTPHFVAVVVFSSLDHLLQMATHNL